MEDRKIKVAWTGEEMRRGGTKDDDSRISEEVWYRRSWTDQGE